MTTINTKIATLDDGLRFDANSGGEKKNKLGSKVTVKGTGAKADSEYDSSNIKTSITQGADGNSEINIGLAKDLNNINTIKKRWSCYFHNRRQRIQIRRRQCEYGWQQHYEP